jgi:hypothetical protein
MTGRATDQYSTSVGRIKCGKIFTLEIDHTHILEYCWLIIAFIWKTTSFIYVIACDDLDTRIEQSTGQPARATEHIHGDNAFAYRSSTIGLEKFRY